MAKKKSEEETLRQAVARDPKLKETSAAWEKIAQAQKVIGDNALDYNLLEASVGFNSHLFGIARTLLRAGEEFPKPNGERLREFVESSRESLEFQLFSEEPIYDDLEILTLANSLTFLIELKGYGHPLVQKILAGRSPDQRAPELVQGSKVKDVELRRKLYKDGKSAVEAAKDPMIELARLVDAEARAMRKIIETQGEIKQQAHAQIGKARFAIQGTSTYPDATFTLRLAYGQVKGYVENGTHVPFQTTFAGLYERAAGQRFRPPFDLPESWLGHKADLDLSTPYNVVNTADIIGGNSGSPVINKNAEVVGLIFDGNIQSLVLDYIYTDEVARAVAVHSSSIPEALRKVYNAPELVGELTGGQ